MYTIKNTAAKNSIRCNKRINTTLKKLRIKNIMEWTGLREMITNIDDNKQDEIKKKNSKLITDKVILI